MAAAGSAVGLGNIWAFPAKAAANGGAVFLFIYLLCIFLIGYPVMVAELAIGRASGKNPVGAFSKLYNSKFFPLVGLWGVICGVMILSFYSVVAGWAFGYAFEEIFFMLGFDSAAVWIGDLNNGIKNAIVTVFFMYATMKVISSGVNDGIERATKLMMPLLIGIILIMIVYVLFQPGAAEGVANYLKPDFSTINLDIIFIALGQAFFSLSLGMGAMITYGSYLSKKENIPQAAAMVTLADTLIAFLAGLLIVPAMFLAKNQGIEIFTAEGDLIAGPNLVFQVLPELFHSMPPAVGLIFGVSFFLLLSIAALTSTISLLEVPVSYGIDEHRMSRKKAVWVIGTGITLISVFLSFNIGLIDTVEQIFSNIGLPLGGILISIFIGYFWKTESALNELESGYSGVTQSIFGKLWPIFIKFICPLAILYTLVSSLIN